jgi:hypothetical protein
VPWLLVSFCSAQDAAPPTNPTARFGTTVVKSFGLRGDIYDIPAGTKKLPSFRKLTPIGAIYTTVLNVPPTEFTSGFPGVTGRFEWFAINYTGRFWIEHPGAYRFSLMSDDGAKLYIDNHVVINNDGVHPPLTREGKLNLTSGVHRIRIAYFQGPRTQVALTLSVAESGGDWRIFDMDEFGPPAGTDHGK